MVERARQLDRLFSALSDPTRRAMLNRLASAERTVGELAEPFRMSLAGVSKHLKVLENARLVQRRIEGREHRLRLNPAPLAAALDWLRRYEAFWEDRLDRLESELRRPEGRTPVR